MAAAGLLLDAGVVLAAVAVGGAIATRLDQSVIPAYIVGGVLLGPNGPVPSLRLVGSAEFIDLLQGLGVILLLFFIGLHFSPSTLVERREAVFRAGGLDLLNGLVGLAFGFLLGFTALEALLLAGVVYISSSAIITKSLIELGWIADPEAESILGLLVFEDIVIAVYLAIVAALALGGTGGAGGGGALTAVGISLAVVALLALLAFRGTPIVERVLDTRSDEQFLVRILAVATLVGGGALYLGVSEAVAAFFLGAAVGGTTHADRVERVITSERDLYAAVFFFAIGLATDLSTLVPLLVPVLALAVVSGAGKLVTGYLGGRAYGLTERRSARVAVAMVARGEFSLVIAAIAVQANLDPRLSALAVGYVLVMSVAGTVLMSQSARVEELAERFFGGEESPAEGAVGPETS
jgi:CPA2 family monovalent cation:H+ antiporter-2